jgi:DNA-binding transcriptional ArsR family regulator
MRALAHPLRLAVLRYLMATGPHTASDCAAEVGSTPSNISWHLRHLATYGLVEPTVSTSRRERPWRATQVGLDFGELSVDPVLRPAQDSIIAASLAEENELTRRFLSSREQMDPACLASARLDSFVLRATPEELNELSDAVTALLRPFVATVRTDAPQSAGLTYVGFRLFPRLSAMDTSE